MKRKAAPIVRPMAKCVRCGVSIGQPRRREQKLPDGTRPWVRFCHKCAMLKTTEGITAESRRIIAAKALAARMALSPEERSEIARRAYANTSREANERRRKLCSETAKKQNASARFPKATESTIAKRVAAAKIYQQTKLAAKIAKGFAECPHCKCTFPLDCFPTSQMSLAGSRDWSRCKLCTSIRRKYGRYPFVMKRTGRLNLPLEFRGFPGPKSKAIYEQYWLPKLDTGEEEGQE